jgi:hypothetical protein
MDFELRSWFNVSDHMPIHIDLYIIRSSEFTTRSCSFVHQNSGVSDNQ